MMKYNIAILCFLFFQQLFAQVKTTEVVQLFSKGGEVSWEISIEGQQKQTLLWQERPNSIKGIKTFVCYQNGEMIGVLSADNQGVSGSLKLFAKSYNITSEDDVIFAEKETKKDGKCGTCCGGGEHSHTARPSARPQGEVLSQEEQILKLHSVRSDGVLRVYRLALLVTNRYFSGQFKNDVKEVEKFWANAEAFLNELYHRDVSVRFEVVRDERLIYKTASVDPFYGAPRARDVHDRGTSEINKLIPESDYDVGAVIYPPIGSIQGLGTTSGVYNKSTKAQCYATTDYQTIAHEVGHLFGTLHTLTTGGGFAYYSEPNQGMSVMGYNLGAPRDYFSLVSIAVIRESLSKIGYYTDRNRTQLVPGEWNSEITNIPYGVKPSNTAPVINTAKIQKEYRLPEGTFFQLHIPAKDAEQQKLHYYAHQVGGYGFPYFSNPAKFLALKPTQTGKVVFEKSYSKNNFSAIDNSSPNVTGTYDFWLAVNDADTSNENHGVYYDQTYTKIHFVSGTPFKIRDGYKKKYTAGEKITLTWEVDNSIFSSGSKVRILMSDDFGETYKYTLVTSTDNDGNAEVTIPHIALGRKTHFGSITSGLGIIKIEVLDHIAHDITDNNPWGGGFEIEATAISFQNTPEPTIEVKKGQVPEKENVMATSTCGGSHSVTPIYSEEKTDALVIRTWTASDGCNNKAIFVQHIYIQEDTTSPNPQVSFANFPANVNISCEKDKPQAVSKLQILGCNGTTEISVTHTDVETGDCKTGKTIERTYTGEACGQTISQKQTINIAGDNEDPTFSEALPKDISVVEGQPVPTQEELTATDNCATNVNVVKTRTPSSDGKTITDIWTATDLCGNEKRHSRTITIVPAPKVAFTNFPADMNVSCEKDKPQVVSKLQVSGCEGTTEISVTHTDVETGDCKTGKTIERTYTGEACGQTISQKQTITIAGDNEAPTFSGTLPQNVSITENQPIPTQEELTATDNCTTNVNVVKTRTPSADGKKITDTWTATDLCGNEKRHSRTITIVPKKSTENASDKKITVFNAVARYGSENYFRIEPIDNYRNVNVQIFDRLGNKVFESADYQRRGEVFRGYANFSSVVAKGRRLPSGTYFYVISYEDTNRKSHTKVGYLLLK